MIPSLFVCHGAPTLAIEDNDYTRFLRKYGERTDPKAIVIFTAHWENEVTTISYRDDEYDTIYDFGGFSEELYRIKYQAQGSREVASLLENELHSNAIKTRRDSTRGLDHGSWVVLRHLYPNAQVPVVQVSVHPFLTAAEQYEIGSAIRLLGEQNILVIGSGGTVHNLREIHWGQSTAEAWAVEFDDWLIDTGTFRSSLDRIW